MGSFTRRKQRMKRLVNGIKWIKFFKILSHSNQVNKAHPETIFQPQHRLLNTFFQVPKEVQVFFLLFIRTQCTGV